MTDDDNRNLPVVRPLTWLANRDKKGALTEQQVDALVRGGVQVAEGMVGIAVALVDIERIRAQSHADVSRIDAETRAVVVKIRAEIEREDASQQAMRDRGSVTVSIIRQVTQALNLIPEIDVASRKALIDHLPTIIEMAIGKPGTP